MVSDKEFLAFENGIFKEYFEEYISFKLGKGEKMARSTLIRLRTLNRELTLSCDTLEISRMWQSPFFVKGKRKVRIPGDFASRNSANFRPSFEVWGSLPVRYHANI